MKSALFILIGLLVSVSANALNFKCEGVDGYEIFNKLDGHSNWTLTEIKQNGNVIAQDLVDNGKEFFQGTKEVPVLVYNAIQIVDGIIQASLSLAIQSTDVNGLNGTGSAVIYVNGTSRVVNGLICQVPAK